MHNASSAASVDLRRRRCIPDASVSYPKAFADAGGAQRRRGGWAAARHRQQIGRCRVVLGSALWRRFCPAVLQCHIQAAQDANGTQTARCAASEAPCGCASPTAHQHSTAVLWSASRRRFCPAVLHYHDKAHQSANGAARRWFGCSGLLRHHQQITGARRGWSAPYGAVSVPLCFNAILKLIRTQTARRCGLPATCRAFRCAQSAGMASAKGGATGREAAPFAAPELPQHRERLRGAVRRRQAGVWRRPAGLAARHLQPICAQAPRQTSAVSKTAHGSA